MLSTRQLHTVQHLLLLLLQAILQHLLSEDHASLREVSKAVCQRTTKHVPFITLRLCEDSRPEQLQQCCQATQQFRHVTKIHIQVTGRTTEAAFDQAMQRLLKRTVHVSHLHLLACTRNSCSNSSGYACVPTLLPVKHIIQHLHTLVLQGIAFEKLAKDLEQLTAAATAADSSWQLRSLTIRAGWCFPDIFVPGGLQSKPCRWSDITSSIRLLPTAFPELK